MVFQKLRSQIENSACFLSKTDNLMLLPKIFTEYSFNRRRESGKFLRKTLNITILQLRE